VKTDLSVVYEPTFTYAVQAGVGEFNGSYVKEYIQSFSTENPGYNLSVVPYSDFAAIRDLVVNPMHSVPGSPVNCSGSGCASYLFPGGLATATPWPPVNYTADDIVLIDSAMATQIDFEDHLLPNDQFGDGDCHVFGAVGVLIGMRFCTAWSQYQPGALAAGELSSSL
jgi:hypothetical protein